jgi:deferrochelatase/peroxidase EfeB
MPALRRDNIQGLIVASYQTECSRHLLFEIADADGTRSFLQYLIPRITRASTSLSGKPEPLINVGITYRGLRQLIPTLEADDPAFEQAFKNLPNTEAMGDVASSAMENWWNRQFSTSQIHLIVVIHCRSLRVLDEATAEIRAQVEGSGLRELLPGDGGTALTGQSNETNPRELHFGYQDGFSQPPVNWDDVAEKPDLIDRREFLLGQEPAEFPMGGSVKKWSSFPSEPPWLDIVADGSIGVMRWIYQDVATFEKFLTEAAPQIAPNLPPEEGRELVAAKMMGRWRNGTPLVLSPDKPDETQKLAYQNFNYQNDQDGLRCPLAAHIRIANHRDDPLDGKNSVMFEGWRPNILRRGHSYGPKLVGEEDDNVDRGVIGLFFCTSINDQFYPLMRWMRMTNFRKGWPMDAMHQQDPIVGPRDLPFADPSFVVPVMENNVRKDVTLSNLPSFVRTKGTVFMLMPGIESLERIAGTRAWP